MIYLFSLHLLAAEAAGDYNTNQTARKYLERTDRDIGVVVMGMSIDIAAASLRKLASVMDALWLDNMSAGHLNFPRRKEAGVNCVSTRGI